MSESEPVRRSAVRQSGVPVLYASGYADDALDLSAREGMQMSFLARPATPCGLARPARQALESAATR